MPFFVAIPASCCAGAAVGFVVGLPALRFRGIYLAITTLAMHYAIIYVLTNYQAIVGPTFGRDYRTGTVPRRLYAEFRRRLVLILLIVAALVVIFRLNISRTYIGRAWAAIRDRDIAAETIGINVPRYKLLAFMISAALAALAGSLGAYFTTVVTVEDIRWNSLSSISP